jgi:hypothetical protein
VRLRPERVLEVRYDQLEGAAFATRCSSSGGGPTATRSCTFEQLETVAAYDLADVLD